MAMLSSWLPESRMTTSSAQATEFRQSGSSPASFLAMITTDRLLRSLI
ncbi:hypothetical protein HL670_05077 [Serratia plymuthica]|nr:hypothetical protein HL670_05077 [Serratia plymuthica]